MRPRIVYSGLSTRAECTMWDVWCECMHVHAHESFSARALLSSTGKNHKQDTLQALRWALIQTVTALWRARMVSRESAALSDIVSMQIRSTTNMVFYGAGNLTEM